MTLRDAARAALREESFTPYEGPSLEARDALRRELARYYLPPEHLVYPANHCRLLRDGVEAYPAMLEAIRFARRTIRLETYMFVGDSVGELFGRALCEAAGRGVEVRVLFDAIGSWSTPRSFIEGLRAKGVDIRPFRPFSWQSWRHLHRRDHRKLLVVDGEVAFIGGVNISEHWAPANKGPGWRDDVLRIEGSAVTALEKRFWASWRLQFRERLLALRHRNGTLRRPSQSGHTGISVLTSRRSIHRAYLHALTRARRSIFVAAGYFIPDRRLVHALQNAARRGVDVTLVLSGRSDHPLLLHASRAFYERLLPAGVKIFEWQKTVLHAKTAVVDGVWGTLGSFNLERFSMRLNHEANVFFADPRLAGALEKSLRSDCNACVQIHLDAFRQRPLWQKFVEKVVYLFRRIL